MFFQNIPSRLRNGVMIKNRNIKRMSPRHRQRRRKLLKIITKFLQDSVHNVFCCIWCLKLNRNMMSKRKNGLLHHLKKNARHFLSSFIGEHLRKSILRNQILPLHYLKRIFFFQGLQETAFSLMTAGLPCLRRRNYCPSATHLGILWRLSLFRLVARFL